MVTRGANWVNLDDQSILSAFGDTKRNRQRHTHWVGQYSADRNAPRGRLILGALLADRPVLVMSEAVLRTAEPETIALLREPPRLLFPLIEPSRPAPPGAAWVALLDESGVLGIGPHSWYDSVRSTLRPRFGSDAPSDIEDDAVDDEE
ncbi:MAG: hypothetical protein O2819_01645 [Planctomycetota bacterium]|nr:hypothetical protein [Planctomycetota bacterium]